MTEQQLDLVKPDQPVYETRLIAGGSPRRAYYHVAVFRLPGAGYKVRKSSGAEKARANIEEWYRPGLQEAMQKLAMLVNAKLNRKRTGRIYIVDQDKPQNEMKSLGEQNV